MSKKKLNETKQSITDNNTTHTRSRTNGFQIKCINQRSRKVLIKLNNELKKANADYVDKIDMYIKEQPVTTRPNHVTLEPLDVHPNHILLRRPDIQQQEMLNKSFQKKLNQRNHLYHTQSCHTLAIPILSQFRGTFL